MTEDDGGRPKHVAYNVRLNKFVVFYRLLRDEIT